MTDTPNPNEFPHLFAKLEKLEPDHQQQIKSQLAELLLALDQEIEDPEPLKRLLFDSLMLYGVFGTVDLVGPISHLYQLAMAHLTIDDRREIYWSLKAHMESGRISNGASMPFLMLEVDSPLVATATIDYAMLGQHDSDDPLAAPKSIIDYIEGRMPANMGAMFGGLLALGDHRVNELLTQVKWTLSDDELGVAVNEIRTGFGYLATIELWISWLEELQTNGLGETRLFAQCATGIYKHVAGLNEPRVVNATRNFGYMFKGDDAPSAEVQNTLSLEEVGQKYADRLYTMEDAERAPKTLPDIMAQFALIPHTAPEDCYREH